MKRSKAHKTLRQAQGKIQRAEKQPAGPETSARGEVAAAGQIIQLQHTIGNRATIQRLMGVDTFRNDTVLSTDSGFKGLFSKGRNKVDAIDQALAAFHAIEYKQGVAKLTALDNLIAACNTYLGYTDKQAKRKTGVRRLLNEANTERPYVQQSAPIFAAAHSLTKARQLVQLQDQLVPLILSGTTVLQGLNLDTAQELSACVVSLPPADKRRFVQDDIDRLNAMSDDDTLPQITRDVLKEVLANLPMIDLQPGQSGAGFTNKADPDPKYFVMNTTNRMLGTGERLGSLTHELTHVSISESYDNTKMMWAFNSGLSDDDITRLSQKRVNQLDQLLGLLDNIPNLNEMQKQRIKDQLEYAKRPNLMADSAALSQPQLDRYNNLAADGVNWSSLVEFDTNINQCLVYMARWGVPNGDAFHTLLQQVAQEAYDEREAG